MNKECQYLDKDNECTLSGEELKVKFDKQCIDCIAYDKIKEKNELSKK